MKSNYLFFLAIFILIACNGNNSTKNATSPSTSPSEKSTTKSFVSPKNDVTAEEAFELIKNSALLIDVRSPSEIKEIAFGVKNVKNIPIDELQNRLSEVPKNIQVIFACRAGGRSSQAFNLLKKNGYENIANMTGGMNQWSEKGLPVTKVEK